MLSVTRLLIDEATPGDDLRYGERTANSPRPAAVHSRPIVVWNITRTCNLHCAHCYAESKDEVYEGELSTEQAKGVIDDLKAFKIPVALFSGGEPLMRHDLPELIAYCNYVGLRPVISSNGTMLTEENTQRLADCGLNRAGISLDGLETVHDKFRGKKGAFKETTEGIRNALKHDMRVSLRITLTKHNIGDLPALVDLAEDLGVQRFCMYHLAYAGRGAKLLSFDLEADERRKAVEFMFKRTQESFRNGSDLEVLTVDNHTDAAYLLKWGQENAPDLLENMHRLLRRNGGNSAGSGIACIDNLGNVHPDQFWWNRTLGSVKDRPFSEIWSDPENEFLAQLRDRKPLLPQRCKECKFLDVCNGNLRVRAESATGDAWGMDPACYLSPEETARGMA